MDREVRKVDEKKKAQTRTRSRAMSIRMTDVEYEKWQDKYIRSGEKNQTDFLMRLLDESVILVIEDYKQCLVELKRQGNNLNQIARHLNEGGKLAADQREALAGAWRLYEQIEGIGNAIIRRGEQ
jgi:hypothetical protein